MWMHFSLILPLFNHPILMKFNIMAVVLTTPPPLKFMIMDVGFTVFSPSGSSTFWLSASSSSSDSASSDYKTHKSILERKRKYGSDVFVIEAIFVLFVFCIRFRRGIVRSYGDVIINIKRSITYFVIKFLWT